MTDVGFDTATSPKELQDLWDTYVSRGHKFTVEEEEDFEARLQELEERFRKLYEAIDAATTVTELQKIYVDNSKFKDMPEEVTICFEAKRKVVQAQWHEDHPKGNGKEEEEEEEERREKAHEYQHADDYGNALVLESLHKQNFLYNGSLGWLHWNKTYWESDSDAVHVSSAAIHALRKRHIEAHRANQTAIMTATKADERRINGCVNAFRTLVSSRVGEFNSDPHVLNTLNGVVDLRTGQIIAHCTDQRFTYCVPVALDELADMGEWTTSLYDNVEALLPLEQQRENIDFLQVCAGYWITGLTREEKLFSLYGPLRAGKSTFVEVFQELFPEPLSSPIDFDSLMQKRDPGGQNFDLAPLQPCRMVFASESNRLQKLDAHKLKSMTGGDRIHCAHKHRDFFSYRPQFKLIIASNWPLNIDPDDDAAWYRAIVFHFPIKREGTEDKQLKERLKSPANLASVLRWTIAGSVRYYQLPNGLIMPKKLADNKQEQRDEVDITKQWLDECCETAPDAFESHVRLYRSYLHWCKQNGAAACGTKTFTQRMTKKGYVSKTAKIPGFKDKTQRGFTNIRFADAYIETIEHLDKLEKMEFESGAQ